MKPINKIILFAFSFLLLGGTGFLAFNFHHNGPPAGEFQELVIPEGKHSARPYWLDFRRNRKTLHLQFVFPDLAAYDLGDSDQYDWNKLTGVAVGFPSVLYTNHRNSAMVSWRWGLDCECIELGIYLHVDGEVYKIKKDGSEVLVTAKTGAPVDAWIHLMQDEHQPGRNWMGVTIRTPGGDAYAEQEYTVNVRTWSRVINSWFGGNRTAPQDIYLLRRLALEQ